MMVIIIFFQPPQAMFFAFCFLSTGEVPERQGGFDFVPFDFDATRRGVENAFHTFALQVFKAILGFTEPIINSINRVWRMGGLTRDGTVEPVLRDRILTRERGQGKIILPVQLSS